jgi:serine/threonine-protein kinase
MGEVWRATDTKLNRDVAIKILAEAFAQDADRMARFTREAQVLASLNHPNIAAIYGVEERALVMELVEGSTLSDRIAQGAIPVDEALPFLQQLIDALEYAHEHGVIYRDLKPANIKITLEGRVKVLDFGLAKAMSPDSAAGDPASSPTLTMRATMAGTIMGTAAYMAPEQARGHSVDKRADIWAFGVVVCEMFTGRRLFDGPTISDTLASVLKAEPEWDQVPACVRRLLRLCLAKDPRRRLRDIGDGRALIEGAELPAAPTGPVAPQRRWGSAAVAGALAVTAALGWMTASLRQPAPEERPLNVQINPPAGADLVFGQAGGSAISPDGQTVAFVAVSSGFHKLWVRPLSSTARELPGTEGAQLPFWLPDMFPTPGEAPGMQRVLSFSVR